MNRYIDYIITGIKFSLWIVLLCYIILIVMISFNMIKNNKFKNKKDIVHGILTIIILPISFIILFIFGIILKIFCPKKYKELKEKENKKNEEN